MRLAAIGMAWIGYFAIHSLLAANTVKEHFEAIAPRWKSGYRLAYNSIATITLIPVLWLVYTTDSTWLWQWRGPWAWVANGTAMLSLLGFLLSARAYDMGDFLGLRQVAAGVQAGGEGFSISSFHRFVRHPWYFFGLAIIWTRDMNGPLLVSASAMTLYFIVGSRLEEQKLISSYGEAYRRYIAAVPGLIPLPGKYLTTSEADTLARRP